MTNDRIAEGIKCSLVDVLVERIEPLFKPGTKFAILVWTPGNENADAIVGDIALDEIRAMCDRLEATGRIV